MKLIAKIAGEETIKQFPTDWLSGVNKQWRFHRHIEKLASQHLLKFHGTSMFASKISQYIV